MAIKFRLRGLAETFVNSISCPECGTHGQDDAQFATELTKVTLEGIVVVVQCRECHEIFVPNEQRCGVINSAQLRRAVERDSKDTGEQLLPSRRAVEIAAESWNAQRKDALH